MVGLPGVLIQHFHNFVPHHRVQTAGCLVQNQQPGLMSHSHRKAQFHFHAPGEISEFFLFRQIILLQVSVIQRHIPILIHPGHDFSHVPGSEHGGKSHGIQNHCNVLFHFGERRTVHIGAQNPQLSGIRPRRPHQTANRCALACAVFSGQTQNTALRERQIHVVQLEILIPFRQSLNFNGVHNRSSSSMTRSISQSASTVKPHAGASCSAARKCCSISRKCSSRSNS